MSDKIYKLSLEQLNDIVSNAVVDVLKKVENIEIIDDTKTENSQTKIEDFSDEQYQEALKVMEANRGHGNEPKVGIFWYNVAQKRLFGVVTHKRTDYIKPNAGGGLITCSEMHEDVWKKEFRKQKYHNNGIGPFIGEYQNKPRGRVFYSPANDQYIIAVGTWIEEHQEAINLIREEFDLPREKTIVQKATHWDIGQTWND